MDDHVPLLGDLVQSWALATPTAIALEQGGRSRDYRWLCQCANAVRHDLVSDWPLSVGVTGKRSFALVATMLGVLSSPHRLVTIDPRLPEARQRQLVELAGVSQLFDCDEQRLPRWRDGGAPALHREAPAYLFFTSGSTGTPKGVVGTQKGLGHFLRWQIDAFNLRPGMRFAQLTSIGFDVVLRDMFAPLAAGATLVLPPAAPLRASDVLHWLAAMRVDAIHTVPSLMRYWLRQAPPDYRGAPLAKIFFAGEPLDGLLVKRCRQVFGDDVEIVNLYGPTETTLAKCFYRVPYDCGDGVQPVGGPLPDTEILVLDDEQRPCERGEVYIRTRFRTLGYLNDSEATARAFFALPDSPEPVYRTGDLGYFDGAGQLHLTGRRDHQVKIRGVRVELAEVETALRTMPGVEEVAVTTQRDPESGELCLAAYFVGDGVNMIRIRKLLSEQLPAAMVPKQWMLMDALPLTPNGKVDRNALP